jgi:Family of unknown function (DUF5996)
MNSKSPRPVRFTLDESHSSYDPEYAHRFWQVLATITPVFQQFRAGFIGKSSPVHFSGEVSISPSLVSLAAARPFIQMPTPSQKKATLTK